MPLGSPRIATKNELVDISTNWRFLLAFYYMFWRAIPESYWLFSSSENVSSTLVIAGFAIFLKYFLYAVPLLLYTIHGSKIGWLHPLVAMPLMEAALATVQTPSLLLSPLTLFSVDSWLPHYEILRGWSPSSYSLVLMKMHLLELVATIAFLLAFTLGWGNHKPVSKRGPLSFKRIPGWKMFLVLLLPSIAFVYLVDVKGGLASHFSSLASGRFRMRQDVGYLLVLISSAPYLLVLWYISRPLLISKIWFWLILLASLIAQFSATGSRSAIFQPAAMLIFSWIWLNHRLPLVRTGVVGVLAFLAIGILGEVRSTGGVSASQESSLASGVSLTSVLKMTREEVERREKRSGAIAVFALVPEQAGYLYGATYLSAVTFMVPRIIWPEKPRGAGASVASMLYGGASSATGYQGGGIPPGGVGEAYWNFGLLGVFIVYIFYGLFLKTLSREFSCGRLGLYGVFAYLSSLVLFTSPSSVDVVSYLQLLVIVYFLNLFLLKKVKLF